MKNTTFTTMIARDRPAGRHRRSRPGPGRCGQRADRADRPGLPVRPAPPSATPSPRTAPHHPPRRRPASRNLVPGYTR